MDPKTAQLPLEHKHCQHCIKSMPAPDLQQPPCPRCAKLRGDCRYEHTPPRANGNPTAGLPVITEPSPKVDLSTGEEKDDKKPVHNEHAGYMCPPELAHMFSETNRVTQVETEAARVGSNLCNKNAVCSCSKAGSTSSAINLASMTSLQDLCRASQLTARNLALVKEQDQSPELCQLGPDGNGPSVDQPEFLKLDEGFPKRWTYRLTHPSRGWDMAGNSDLSHHRVPNAIHNHLLSRHEADALSDGTITDTTSSGPSIFSATVDNQSNSNGTSSHGLIQRAKTWDDASSTSSMVLASQIGRSSQCLLDALNPHAKTSKSDVDQGTLERVWNCSHPDCQFRVHLRLLNVGSDLDDHDPYLVDVWGPDIPEFIALSYAWGNDGGLARMTIDNQERYHRSISISTLPKGFRHAIKMTRIMGCKYLWIDSMCIVSDDMQDRDTQLLHMKQIYANAFAILILLGKASSQSVWAQRSYILQEASFSSRIIPIPQSFILESPVKDSPRVRIQSFLDDRDDLWTPLKVDMLSELRQSRTPEMKISFKSTANAPEQRLGTPSSGGYPNPDNSSKDNDMFKFLFPADNTSQLQLRDPSPMSSNAIGNGLCLQLTFAEMPTVGELDEMIRKLESTTNTVEFGTTKAPGPDESRTLLEPEELKKAVRLFGGACLRCFVMRKGCDLNHPCSSCVAAEGKTSSCALPCRPCWLERSRAAVAPSWSRAFHHVELRNSKINNRMSIDTLRRHMEMVYGIVASDYQWEKQISRWRIRHPLSLPSVTHILLLVENIRTLLQCRIFEAGRATAAAPPYFPPGQVLWGETVKDVRSHRNTTISGSALLQPTGYVLHSSPQKLTKLMSPKRQAGFLDLELRSNKDPDSFPTDANSESAGDSNAVTGDKLDYPTDGAVRCGPSGSRRVLGSDNRGRGNRGGQSVRARPTWSNLIHGPQRIRRFRCPCHAGGLTANHTPQCYRTAGNLQRIKDYHLKKHHHWSNNRRWLPRVHGDTDEDKWNRLFLKANPCWADEHPEEPLPSPYHELSDIKDYVPHYPAEYPERLWPQDVEPTADNVLVSSSRPGSNTELAVTGLPTQTNFVHEQGPDSSTLLPAVALSENLHIRYHESELRPTDKPWYPEQLSMSSDLVCDPQSPSPLSPIPGQETHGEDDDTHLLEQYPTTISNTSTYPDSPLFSPRPVGGSNTEPTSSSMESTHKLCFCEDTCNSLDPHYFCREREQCLCEPCRGWKVWSDRGKDILGRAIKGEIPLAIPERSSRTN